jgi:hypothetical protein
VVPAAGLEPARAKSPTDFKSVMSTIPSRRLEFLSELNFAFNDLNIKFLLFKAKN